MKLKIDTCMATHVKWDVPTGTISAEPGAVFSGAYGFIIKLHGQAGHGSRPDLAHSVLDCFNNIYNHINMIRMKYVAPTDILTCSVGFRKLRNRPQHYSGRADLRRYDPYLQC